MLCNYNKNNNNVLNNQQNCTVDYITISYQLSNSRILQKSIKMSEIEQSQYSPQNRYSENSTEQKNSKFKE